MPFLCYPAQVKQFKLTAANIKEYRSELTTMNGKKMTCIAMFALTEETIYKVSLKTIKKCMVAAKKLIALGPRTYSSDSKTFKLVAQYEAVRTVFHFTSLQVQMKMHPSKAEETLFDMICVSEKQEEKAAIEKENAESETDSYKAKKATTKGQKMENVSAGKEVAKEKASEEGEAKAFVNKKNTVPIFPREYLL